MVEAAARPTPDAWRGNQCRQRITQTDADQEPFSAVTGKHEDHGKRERGDRTQDDGARVGPRFLPDPEDILTEFEEGEEKSHEHRKRALPERYIGKEGGDACRDRREKQQAQIADERGAAHVRFRPAMIEADDG